MVFKTSKRIWPDWIGHDSGVDSDVMRLQNGLIRLHSIYTINTCVITRIVLAAAFESRDAFKFRRLRDVIC